MAGSTTERVHHEANKTGRIQLLVFRICRFCVVMIGSLRRAAKASLHARVQRPTMNVCALHLCVGLRWNVQHVAFGALHKVIVRLMMPPRPVLAYCTLKERTDDGEKNGKFLIGRAKRQEAWRRSKDGVVQAVLDWDRGSCDPLLLSWAILACGTAVQSNT